MECRISVYLISEFVVIFLLVVQSLRRGSQVPDLVTTGRSSSKQCVDRAHPRLIPLFLYFLSYWRMHLTCVV